MAYCFMRACIRKVKWLGLKERVPSGRRQFNATEIGSATFEAINSLRKLGEVTENLEIFAEFYGVNASDIMSVNYPVIWFTASKTRIFFI